LAHPTILRGLTQIFWQVHYGVQWPVRGMFRTAMVFKLCRMRSHVAFAHNGHVDFGQWLGPGRSQKSLSIVPCKGTIKRQKKATWETTTKYYKAACTWWNSAGITTIGTFHIRIHTLRGPYRSFLLWAVLGSI
jgi:hypothetical protein